MLRVRLNTFLNTFFTVGLSFFVFVLCSITIYLFRMKLKISERVGVFGSCPNLIYLSRNRPKPSVLLPFNFSQSLTLSDLSLIVVSFLMQSNHYDWFCIIVFLFQTFEMAKKREILALVR
jgi:ABC-type dipeptide/oligopeptide/nickel transport system permease component